LRFCTLFSAWKLLAGARAPVILQAMPHLNSSRIVQSTSRQTRWMIFNADLRFYFIVFGRYGVCTIELQF
jgi:hypothetical protein